MSRAILIRSWLAAVAWLWLTGPVWAIRIGDICRVKGQEENTLQGLGLVVGLNGTGDGADFGPKIQALANALHRMGSPLGAGGFRELRNTKNAALVLVTATVPSTGARQGDTLKCVVTSIGDAKSLKGGYLVSTPLQGPFVAAEVGQTKVYGFAQGTVQLDDERQVNRGSIVQGARLEADLLNPYVVNGQFTLVLRQSHASFSMASQVAYIINSAGGDTIRDADAPRERIVTAGQSGIARAVDQLNVLVTIPDSERQDPVYFIQRMLDEPLDGADLEARVTVNRDKGTIVIGERVEVGPAVINHGNMVIEAGANVPTGEFIPVDSAARSPARLQALVTTLQAIRLSTTDIIDIIETLDKNGSLHGTLVIE
jgi:flagellar P-ring protein precursor FlgI